MGHLLLTEHMWAGSEFHAAGPASLKACSLKVVHVMNFTSVYAAERGAGCSYLLSSSL